MIHKTIRFIMIVAATVVMALPASPVRAELLNGHSVVMDAGGIIPWTPDPAQGYDHVMGLAWDYLLNRVPSDGANGKPYYYSYSFLLPDTQQPYNWPHNPAGLFAMLTESALKYYGYSGNRGVVDLARNAALAILDNGRTPTGWLWGNVPYASGDAGSLIYQGAAFGDGDGRGDGRGVIQPDKVGEMGYAWLQLYRFDGTTRFRDAAIAAADTLAARVRPGNQAQSPWPFRVYAQTGTVREEYCANVIGPIRLFDALINLGLGNTQAYRSARQTAWNWLMTYPMRTNVWSNYFEDDPIQPDLNNLDQYSAMMTARYLLEHPEYDPDWQRHVTGLIAWVEQIFGEPAFGATTIAEQIIFHHPMGSHTARYASVNALLYDRTGDTMSLEKAYRALNWATYMARPDGVVIDGPEVNNQWFTDGYGDYIRHFMTSLAAVPQWAPPGQNHLLGSSSVITTVDYQAGVIGYTVADSASEETLRLGFVPVQVTVDGQPLQQRSDLSQAGWVFEQGRNLMAIRHDSGTRVQISGNAQPEATVTALTLGGLSSTLPAGTQQQLAVKGTFSDGSSQDLTGRVNWSSSNPTVASVNTSGLLTCLGAGSTAITARLGALSTSAPLTVQAVTTIPLTVQTASLAGGTVGTAYSATLTASGGTPPLTWSLAGGTIPPGLTLASNGAISGTPTTAGTFGVSIRVSDGAARSATRSYTVSVADKPPVSPVGESFSLWSPQSIPAAPDGGADAPVEVGVRFLVDTPGYITGIRFYKSAANMGLHTAHLWSGSGELLASTTFMNESASGWQQASFPTPVPVNANTVYLASYHTDTGHYSSDVGFFAGRGVYSNHVYALTDGAAGPNGVYAYGPSGSFPSQGYLSVNYWVDVVFRQ